MGNSSSTVTAGIKNQVNASSNAIYPLADFTGNGELASLAKEAIKNNSTELLDDAIREKITPFLYNEGKGEMLPVDKILQMRHKERTGNDFTASSHLKKYICWKLDSRGTVGETLLHVCFLSGLPDHMKLLAERLIFLFPNIINDFYVSDEYYGETALHMGIVNENAAMVRFLLRNGASVDVRCTGNFFTADDQKSSRVDSVQSEHAFLCRRTDYIGHLYWGEYPLAFAACLSQVDCFRMLCAYGADPNWQDTNGNTVLHICTIHDNWNMFDLALKCGAKLQVQNRQHLTPLTLAAYLAKKEMFESIVKEERHVYWTYGGVISAWYPLQHLDSIDPSTGKINRHSGLALVVYGDSARHLELLPNLLEELVRKKWNTYGRKEHLKQLVLFTIYFCLMFLCFLHRPTPFERTYQHRNLFCFATWNLNELQRMTAKEKAYFVLNITVVIGAALYLLQMYLHIRNVGRRMYFLSLRGFPAKSVFLVSCCLVVFTFVLRLMCLDGFEDIIWIICILLTAVKFLFYFRGFKSVGPFVLILYKIIVRDLTRFFIIYCIIVIGFSQAFYVLFLGYRRNDPKYNPKEGSVMSNVAESFIRMFIMSLTEFAVFFEQLENTALTTLGKIVFIVYMLLVTMLLMNLLIALMSSTYTEVAANSLEYLRQWSAVVLNMEQSFDAENRLRFQRLYSVPEEGSDQLGLLLKFRLTQKELDAEKLEIQKKRKRFLDEKRRMEADE